MDSRKKVGKKYSWLQANSKEKSKTDETNSNENSEDWSKIKELTNKNINTGFLYNSATLFLFPSSSEFIGERPGEKNTLKPTKTYFFWRFFFNKQKTLLKIICIKTK